MAQHGLTEGRWGLGESSRQNELFNHVCRSRSQNQKILFAMERESSVCRIQTNVAPSAMSYMINESKQMNDGWSEDLNQRKQKPAQE